MVLSYSWEPLNCSYWPVLFSWIKAKGLVAVKPQPACFASRRLAKQFSWVCRWVGGVLASSLVLREVTLEVTLLFFCLEVESSIRP